jgi:Flp pilus assembly CpaF family ATPase
MSTRDYLRPAPPHARAEARPDRGHRTQRGPELGGEAFRAAVEEIRTQVAEAVDEAADREEAMRLIRVGVSRWAQDRLLLGSEVPAEQVQRQLAQAVFDERFAMGALSAVLEDPDVENIDVNGCDQVWITYADGVKVRGPAVAASDEELIEKVRLWGIHGGMTAREFSAASPLLNTALEQGTRLSAVMAVTPRPHLSIRRHRLTEVTLPMLHKLGTIDEGLRSLLAAAVRARKNIVVTGGVNAGKTTLLRALAAEIDPDERIATLESEYELYLHRLESHHDVVALESRLANSEGVGAITLHDLIPQALRLNPARIIVGEVRSTEVIPMLEAMNSGQEGSLTTIHANRAEEIFNRILILALRGGLHIAPEAIHLLTGMALDLVVHIQHEPRSNARYVAEVMEVLPPADAALPARNIIYRPGPSGRAVPAATPHFLPELVAAGFQADLLDHRGGLWAPIYQRAGGSVR